MDGSRDTSGYGGPGAPGPLEVAVASFEAALDDLAGSSWVGASEGELGRALAGFTRVQSRLVGAQLQVAAEADRVGVGSAVGASSAAAWWAHTSKVTHRAARSAVRWGRDLDTGGACPVVGAALREGLVVEEQARVIVRAIGDLPRELAAATRELAEKTLVDLAGEYDADALRVLGRGILTVVAPEVAEEHERRKLEGQERRAWEQTRFTLTDDGQGMTRGRFTIPTAQAHLLRKLILAFLARERRHAQQDPQSQADEAVAPEQPEQPAQPEPPEQPGFEWSTDWAFPYDEGPDDEGPDDEGPGDSETSDEPSDASGDGCGDRGSDQESTGDTGPQAARDAARAGAQAMGEALVALIEAIPVDSLPAHGGVNPTIVATMTLDQLTGHGPGAQTPVTLDTGEKITAGQARRWACGAGIIPAVLGTASVVLDMGRRARFYYAPQRLALALRDGGCTAVGCDRPPAMCQAHHMDEWVRDHGRSDLAVGRLLCGHHHRLVHDRTYVHTIRADGQIEFTRIDPTPRT